jgi:glycosyltransferase involved in cell wall biosynthesis
VNAETYRQDPMLRKLIDVVPFGIPAKPPQKKHAAVLKGVHPGIGPEDKILHWHGGLWQWLDPLTLIEALVEVLRVRDDVKVFFAGARHFDPATVPQMPMYAQTVARCRELNLLDRYVFFSDWIPYDDRADYLLEADLGISLHRPSLESRFAWRTRLLDYIWAGLPIVSTVGDPTADLVEAHGLGRTVPAGQGEALAQTILSMLADDGLRDRVDERAQPLREAFAWTRVVEPIAAFVERAAFAPDALHAARRAAQERQTLERLEALEEQVASLEEYVGALKAHIEAVGQGRVMRLLRKLDAMLGRG